MFEYTIHTVAPGSSVEWMNEFGHAGWELVSVLHSPEVNIRTGSGTTFRSEYLQFYFKRRTDGQSEDGK